MASVWELIFGILYVRLFWYRVDGILKIITLCWEIHAYVSIWNKTEIISSFFSLPLCSGSEVWEGSEIKPIRWFELPSVEDTPFTISHDKAPSKPLVSTT